MELVLLHRDLGRFRQVQHGARGVGLHQAQHRPFLGGGGKRGKAQGGDQQAAHGGFSLPSGRTA
jgi:hypothetical protein